MMKVNEITEHREKERLFKLLRFFEEPMDGTEGKTPRELLGTKDCYSLEGIIMSFFQSEAYL